jgi:hypothetical protein
MSLSTTFVVGLLSSPFDSQYEQMIQSAPMFLSSKPVFYFSEPLDNPSQAPSLPTGSVPVVVRTHRIAFNSNTGNSELIAFVTPSPSYPDLFRDLAVNTSSFMPYFRVSVDPMVSKLTRFWNNSLGNSLNGRELMVQLQVASSETLAREFNPDALDTLEQY